MDCSRFLFRICKIGNFNCLFLDILKSWKVEDGHQDMMKIPVSNSSKACIWISYPSKNMKWTFGNLYFQVRDPQHPSIYRVPPLYPTTFLWFPYVVLAFWVGSYYRIRPDTSCRNLIFCPNRLDKIVSKYYHVRTDFLREYYKLDVIFSKVYWSPTEVEENSLDSSWSYPGAHLFYFDDFSGCDVF